MSRRLMILFLLLALVCGAQRLAAADKCLSCHRDLGDNPSTLYAHDIHAAKGISCAGCHGGNPNAEEMEVAMSPAQGFTGVPKGDAISRMCAGCHSDAAKMKGFGSALPVGQWEKLQTSVHATSDIKGGEHIVQCVTCHSVHNIAAVSSPASPVYPLNIVTTCSKCHSNAAFMRDYNPSLPVDQVEKYRTSVHGTLNAKGDAKVAECASCHGSHEIRSAKDVKSTVYAVNLPSTCAQCHSDAVRMKSYGIETDQFEKFRKGVHGMALLEKHDVGAPACNDCHGNHGAAPPGVESVSKVCGTCHALNAELFSSSPHKKAFDARKLPECETCHGNHEIVATTDRLLGVGSGTVCSRCHTERENQKGFAAARAMRSLIDSLDNGMALADSLMHEAEQKGMEVSEAKFKLRDARQSRLQSRTMVHAFNEAKFREVVDQGLGVVATVSGEGRGAIDEFYFRRWGLGIATVIITIVGLCLYVVIRRIERRQQERRA